MRSASSNDGNGPNDNAFALTQNTSQGMIDLPDEVVLKIMEFVVERCRDAVRLMLVCSRFRLIATSPTLWAQFKLRMWLSSEEISAIVHRSQRLPLKADVCINYGNQEDMENGKVLPSHAERVLRHSALFEELCISVPRNSNDFWRGFHMQFPMPLLLRLETTFVPEPMAVNNIITHCQLQVEDWAITYPRLLDFLDSVPLLRLLVISPVIGADYSGIQAHVQAGRTLTLRNLEQMHIGAHVSCTSYIVALLNQLVLDNLERLSFLFSKAIASEVLQDSHITAIAHAITKYRSLQLLSIMFSNRIEGRLEDPNFFGEDMTIDDFEALMLGSVSTGIDRFRCMYTQMRSLFITWVHHPGSRNSPRSVSIRVAAGRDLTTDALLNKITVARRGVATVENIVAIMCPGVDESRIHDAYPDASICIF